MNELTTRVNDVAATLTDLPWVKWPPSSPRIEEAALRVLRSGRWATSGMSVGRASEEREFARMFGEYLGVESVVLTANGSSALVVALQACGIGFGDEVLVPGLAWVACASAVIRVGAIPVFVDIDPETYSMDAVAAAELIGPNTAAILVTHLSSSIADLDAFEALADRHRIAIIEDCSQAHGAIWRGKRVGSFGEAAGFSFQSSKLLTAGEGGAAVSRNAQLSSSLQQIRADGRQWIDHEPASGFPDLTVGAGQQGHNYCITELQAAILSASLPELDAQNEVRWQRAQYLESRLAGVEGVTTVRRKDDPRVDRATFWHLPIKIDSDAFAGATAETIRAGLSTLVGLYLEPVGAPMPEHPLYRPHLYQRFPRDHVQRLSGPQRDLEFARRLSETCFTLPHHALLAEPETLDRFVERIDVLRGILSRRQLE